MRAEHLAPTPEVAHVLRTHTFQWSVERHAIAPPRIRRTILTLAWIRHFEMSCPLVLLPNELLFEICSWL